jgi:AraC family transcriptional regulator
MLAPLIASNFKALAPLRTHHGILRAPIAGDGFSVEARQYGFENPAYGVFQSRFCYLQLGLGRPSTNPKATHREIRPDSVFARIGEVLLVPAETPLYTRCAAGEQRVLCCEFDTGKVAAFAEIDWDDRRLAATLDVDNARIRLALRRLAEEVLSPGFASDVLVESMVTALVVELYRQFAAPARAIESRAGGLAAWQLRRIEDAIGDAAGVMPSIAALAAECGVSPRHLMRLFKASAGVTLGDYVAETRIRRAKALLGGSRPLIKEAAYLCGFKTAAAFSAAFRRATGRTPRQFRQETAGRRASARIAKWG